MPDPRNFRPCRFHTRDYGFTVANPFADHDFDQGAERHTVVDPGKQLRLRFGVLVYSHSDSTEVSGNAAYDQFLKTQQIAASPLGPAWDRQPWRHLSNRIFAK